MSKDFYNILWVSKSIWNKKSLQKACYEVSSRQKQMRQAGWRKIQRNWTSLWCFVWWAKKKKLWYVLNSLSFMKPILMSLMNIFFNLMIFLIWRYFFKFLMSNLSKVSLLIWVWFFRFILMILMKKL